MDYQRNCPYRLTCSSKYEEHRDAKLTVDVEVGDQRRPRHDGRGVVLKWVGLRNPLEAEPEREWPIDETSRRHAVDVRAL